MLILNDIDDSIITNHMINTMIIHYKGLANSETYPPKKRLYEAQLIYLQDIICSRRNKNIVITRSNDKE